jgi:hypothetical protein
MAATPGTAQVSLTSAASAAFLLASSFCESDCAPEDAAPPSVRGGPPTFRGTEEVFALFGAGAESRVRPGWENGSGDDSLPHKLPIVCYRESVAGQYMSIGA